MMDQVIPAKVEAKLNITPNRSQTFLVAAVIFATVLAICSVSTGNESLGWAFLGFSLITFALAFSGWWKSQADVDSENAHPTNLELPNGTLFTTDLRTMRDPRAIQNVLQVIDATINRQPLPQADGLVDTDLKIIFNSEEKAQAITNQINNDTQVATNILLDALKFSEESKTVAPVLLVKASDN